MKNKRQKVKTEFQRYDVYMTMWKIEDGQKIWTTVPLAHPDFKLLKMRGYKALEKWHKKGARNVPNK